MEYPDPRVEPILKETYGIMVYQEQVMQMAQIVGGYSLGGADLLRRAMGKKKLEEMAKERAKFREGAAKDGLTGDKADSIFDLMEKFAGYGFNKSHSAAYALVSYQTAWLKAHYPAEFMAATISSDMDNTDKVVTFLDESRAIGITVLPPDVNASEYMFVAVEPRTIQYGLGAIKGVGQGACEAIVAERAQRQVHRSGRFLPPGRSDQAQPPRAGGTDPVRRAGRAGGESRQPDAAAARRDQGRRAASARQAVRPERHVRRSHGQCRRHASAEDRAADHAGMATGAEAARRARHARALSVRPSHGPLEG